MSDDCTIRVLCVDDHPLMRQGIAAVIKSQRDMALVGEASTGKEAIALFKVHRPDVTLMDLRLLDMDGIEVLMAIRADFPQARIVILTTFEGDAEINRAISSGAAGYLLKSMTPKEIVDAIHRVHAGKKTVPPVVAAQLAEHLGEEPLTAREIEVLQHIAGGNRNRDIADLLSITEETVKVHIKHIMEKLDATDRTQAVAIGLRRGMIHL